MNLIQFYKSAKTTIERFSEFIEKHNLTKRAKADHICYKCSSSKSFEDIRKLFESESQWIYRSIISERRIALIKLKKSIESMLGEINLLELSDQKLDGSQKEGFDHIEIYPSDGNYNNLINYLNSRKIYPIKVERPHHTTYDIKINNLILRLTQEPLTEKITKEINIQKL